MNSVTLVQDVLVWMAALTVVAEIGCLLFSTYFCTRCPVRWIRNWRRVAWIMWLNVIPIRFGFDVDPGWWQVLILGHLALTALAEMVFKWKATRGPNGDRCPGPNEYVAGLSLLDRD